MDGQVDGWKGRCLLLLPPFVAEASNLLNKTTALCLKLAEVYFFPSLNIDSQTERQVPCLNTSQFSKTVAVRGLHCQATVERERVTCRASASTG